MKRIGDFAAALTQQLTIHKGVRVYDVADPRHVGVIKCISLSERTATIKWEDTGWLSVRWPLAGLRRIEAGEDR